MSLHYMGLATSLKRARQDDLNEAKLHMAAKRDMPDEDKRQVTATRQLSSPSWTMEETRAYAAAKLGRCVLVLDDYVVDATTYLSEHVRSSDLIQWHTSLTKYPSSESRAAR